MSYVSTIRVTVKEGSAGAVDALVQQMLAMRSQWQGNGDLLRATVLRSDDGTQYELFTVWSSKSAHDQHEDDPAEAPLFLQLVPYLAGEPSEIGGEIVAEVG